MKPYAAMRIELVREANPALDDGEVRLIVDATAGLLADEIRAVARAYQSGATLPTPPALSWCRDPLTGEYCERQLDPFAVADQLRRHGFRVRICHSFRRFPLNLLNGMQFSPLNRRLFNLRAEFIIAAEKL